jgi:hypothetical protein
MKDIESDDQNSGRGKEKRETHQHRIRDFVSKAR